MKNSFHFRAAPILSLLLWGLVAPSVWSQTTYLWNVASPGANNWNVNGDWLPGTGYPGSAAPGESADTAVFGATGTSSASTSVNNVVSASTTISTLNYTNSTSGNWHVTDIPSGVTLNVTNVTVGGIVVATGSPVTQVALTDAGTLAVYGSLAIGNNDTATAGASATFDLSGLGNFVFNNPAGTLALSTGTRSAGNLNLAGTSNYIVAATINDNTAQSSSSTTGNLRLGSGTNNINAGAFNIGAGRGSTTVSFLNGSGGLRLRGIAGTDSSLAAVTIGNRNNGGGSGNSVNCNFSLNGGTVDMMISTLTLGESGSNPTGTANGVGTLSFDTGTVYASNIVMGVSSGSTTGVQATGNINVGASATLIIGPGGMSMGNRSGTAGTAVGNLAINNGTVICSNNIFKTTSTGSTASITNNSGIITLVAATNTIGTQANPIDVINLNGGTLNVNIDGSLNTASLNGTTVTAGGVAINIGAIANVVVPKTIHLVNYISSNGDPFSGFYLNSTPSGYTCTLVDNPGSVDVSIVPPSTIASLIWSGAANNNWDQNTTANWLNDATASTYADPDLVQFDDTASKASVNLTTAVGPGALLVTNYALNYTFTGSGSITGAVQLVKAGSAALTLAETGGDSFSSGIAVNDGTVVLDDANSTISGGVTIGNSATLQVGNNDANGILPAGGIADNGSLIFNRANNVLVVSPVTGSGTVTQSGAGTVTFSGNNTFTGQTMINGGTLALTNSGSLSNSTYVTIGSGSLDLSALSSPTLLQTLQLNGGSKLVLAMPTLNPPLTISGNFSMSGSGNAVSLTSLPGIASYPSTITLMQCPNGIGGFNLTLGSLPTGYTGSVSLSSDTTSVLLTLTSGPIGVRANMSWVGVDELNNVNTNWSDAANWQLPGAPTPVDNVIFTTTAAQSSPAISPAGGGATALSLANVNNFADNNYAIASLTYTNLNGTYQNTYINFNRTVTVTNSMTVGSTSADFGGSASEFVDIAGAKGTLIVTNPNSTFNVGLESASSSGSSGAQATLDLSGLGTFNATVNTFQVGAFSTTAVLPSGVLYLAQTNLITATGGTNNETGQSEAMSLMIGESGKGSTVQSYLYLGQQNTINANFIGIAIAKQPATLEFNPALVNPVVNIHGGNGSSPVTVWAIGDGLAQTGSSTAPTGTADFTGGTVNASIGTLYLGRSPNASGAKATSGTFTFGAGTVSVGTIYNGLQAFNTSDYGVGTVNINGTGILQVNNLNLGWTTGSSGSSPCTGTVNINGGMVQAGVIAADTNNVGQSVVTLNNGTLAITGHAGTTANPLTSLTINGGSLQLGLSAGVTNIVSTSVSIGALTPLTISSISGVTTNATLPVITYLNGSDPTTNNLSLNMPPGFIGHLTDDGISTIALVTTNVVSTTPFKITNSFSGSLLKLSWPANHTGWRLLVQTNDLNKGLDPSSNAWFTVPGSTVVDQTNITINSTNGAVFYKMVFP